MRVEQTALNQALKNRKELLSTMLDNPSFNTYSARLADICHNDSLTLPDELLDRYQLNQKPCLRDLSIVYQGHLLNLIFDNQKSNSFQYFSLHDRNLIDLWCIFFEPSYPNSINYNSEQHTDRQHSFLPVISYAAFLLITDDFMFLFNQNAVQKVPTEIPKLSKSTLNAPLFKQNCKKVLENYL